jgi:hypothetical protein
MSKEPCQKSVPIFPVRYSVKPRENKVDILKTDFPVLKHSEYVLRLVRTGYIYLYDDEKKGKGLHIWEAKEDGMFQKIVAKQGSIASISKSVYDKENKHYQLEEKSTPYVLARAKATEVYVGFSDALWTSDILKKIMADTDNIRTNLMTKIDVDGWDKASPAKETFSMGANIENDNESYSNEFLEEFVEEYKEDDWSKKFSWSPYQTQNPVSQGKALKSIMDAYPTSEVKSIGVMLYDNIGLVVDQGAIMDKYRENLSTYLSNEDNAHKKIISDCVEMFYAKEVSSNNDNSPFDKVIEEKSKKLEKATYILDNRYGHQRRNASNYIKKYKPMKEYETFRSKIFEQDAKDRQRTIKEEKRLEFIAKYKIKVEVLVKKLMESKEDRWIHLYNYLDPKLPIHLGSSFLNYDINNKVAADLHGQSFALCIRNIMLDTHNPEHDLFGHWLSLPAGKDPVWNALTWAYWNKPDTTMGVIDALAKLPLTNASNKNDNLSDKANNLNDEIEQQSRTVTSEAKERLRLEKLLADEMNKLHSKFTVTEITKNLVYTQLPKPKMLNGAALASGNKGLAKIFTSNHPDKLAQLEEKINDKRLSYSQTIKVEYLDVDTYLKKFGEAINMTSNELQKLHFSGDVNEILGKDKIPIFSMVKNTDILDSQINMRKAGQLVDASMKSAEHAQDVISKSQQNIEGLKKSYNPFVVGTNQTLSPLVVLANALNLSRAIHDFECKEVDTDCVINSLNLTAAIFGTVSAFLYATETYVERSTLVVSKGLGVKTIISSSTLKIIRNSTKVFGAVAAAFDAFTQYGKSVKATKNDNEEASDAYLAASLLLGAGGVVIAFASAPVWILISVGLLVGGMFQVSKADGLRWDDADKWLNACVWGGEREIPNNKLYGKNWDKEYADFVAVYFNPLVDSADWKSDVELDFNPFGETSIKSMSKRLEFTIYFPLSIDEQMKFGFHFRKDYSTVTTPTLTEALKSQKGLVGTVEYEVKIEGNRVRMVLKGIPNSLDIVDFLVQWKMPFLKESYSLKSQFSLDSSWIIDESKPIKTKTIKG